MALLEDPHQEAELRQMAIEERDATAKQLKEIEEELVEALIPADVADRGNAILELRPAAGGLEASLFAGDMLTMYEAYAARRNWKWEVLSTAATDAGGLREAVVAVEGEGVFSYLKFESGVHRVQRVPETETAGRIHTSTATVAVLSEPEENTAVVLKDDEIRSEVFRCGGAGGQHVNKTESGVRLTHIPTGLQAIGQADRSQHRVGPPSTPPPADPPSEPGVGPEDPYFKDL